MMKSLYPWNHPLVHAIGETFPFRARTSKLPNLLNCQIFYTAFVQSLPESTPQPRQKVNCINPGLSTSGSNACEARYSTCQPRSVIIPDTAPGKVEEEKQDSPTTVARGQTAVKKEICQS